MPIIACATEDDPAGRILTHRTYRDGRLQSHPTPCYPPCKPSDLPPKNLRPRTENWTPMLGFAADRRGVGPVTCVRLSCPIAETSIGSNATETSMPRATRFAVLLWLLTPFGATSAAPTYIDAAPLADIAKVPPAQVAAGRPMLPLITWGGDIRTIHANGDARRTAAGSLFALAGLDFSLQREDRFQTQVESYLAGRTPYLRGTLGMIAMAAELLSQDPRTRPVVIYQISESAGGDALVVKEGIRGAADLCGKRIALQAYGPHVDYLGTILDGAGCKMSDVTLKWVRDLSGGDQTPAAAFYEPDVEAAMVIIPDALMLTSNGTVGTGAEDSVKGARILLSTKTANRVIADVYAVRADYLEANRSEVEALVLALMRARERTAALVNERATRGDEYRKLMQTAAELLLDSRDATADAEALYADAEHMSFADNVRFFTDDAYPRNFARRSAEIQSMLQSAGLIRDTLPLAFADWDFAAMRQGIEQAPEVDVARFDPGKVSAVVARKQQQGTLDDGAIFSFQVYFKPNQKDFSLELYAREFDRVIDLASTYGGALITIEGHSDPLGYLKRHKANAGDLVLRQIQQAARNLSLSRANAVRDAVIAHADSKKIGLDRSQFATLGHGITQPSTGMCGALPCAPKTEQEWLSNMRVQFRVIQIEAEAEVFRPL